MTAMYMFSLPVLKKFRNFVYYMYVWALVVVTFYFKLRIRIVAVYRCSDNRVIADSFLQLATGVFRVVVDVNFFFQIEV